MHRVQSMFAALLASENKRAKVEITVSVFDQNERRLHQTFRLKAWTNRDGERMVTADLNDGDWGAGTYATKVVHYNTTKGEKWTAKGQSDKLLDYAARAALAFAEFGVLPTPSNGRVECVEASHCGACGLKLTDPVSIERGIGPECFGKTTGTKTIRAHRRESKAEKALGQQRRAAEQTVAAIEDVAAVTRGASQLQELPGKTWEDIFKVQG